MNPRERGFRRRDERGEGNMLKTHYRDYATEAYRLHARLGSAAAYKRRIYVEAQQRQAQGGSGVGSPTEAAVLRGEAAVAQKESVWRDLEAVERAIERIASRRNGDCILRAVREVYQVHSETPLERGEIADRVIQLSMEMPASPRSIYGWLSLARDVFAEERGLRMKE